MEKKKFFLIFLKIFTIVLIGETIIMHLLPLFPPMSKTLDILIDSLLLTLLSSFSIWFIIYLPEQKKAKLKNHTLEQELEALNQICIITATDLQGRIIYANKNFYQISGFAPNEIILKKHNITKSNHHSKDFYDGLWNTLKQGKTWSGKFCNISKTKEVYWVDSFIVPIFNNWRSI